MYTPVNPSFSIQKLGLRGSKLNRHVFVMKRVTKYKYAIKISYFEEFTRYILRIETQNAFRILDYILVTSLMSMMSMFH